MDNRILWDIMCPDFERLTRWQRLKERWFGVKSDRKRLVFKVENNFVCSPSTYEWLKERITGTGWKFE